MKRHPLAAFFLISFAITWGLAALFLLFSSRLIGLFGEPDLGKPVCRAFSHPAVYGAPVSAFIVIGIAHGAAGLRAYLRRLLRWRMAVFTRSVIPPNRRPEFKIEFTRQKGATFPSING